MKTYILTIVFGKTNLPRLAMDTQSYNDLYGQTNNPWDTSLTPGGSSGGAAAALAAGLTGLEIGNDIGGSIRIPAHFCGIYGHKPTYGIVSRHGPKRPWIPCKSKFSLELDLAVNGPLARSAVDLKLAMEIIVDAPVFQRKAYTISLCSPRTKHWALLSRMFRFQHKPLSQILCRSILCRLLAAWCCWTAFRRYLRQSMSAVRPFRQQAIPPAHSSCAIFRQALFRWPPNSGPEMFFLCLPILQTWIQEIRKPRM